MTDADVAIVGAGAAGLATAIFTRRADSRLRVVVFEGAKKPGAKILVSGGSRCNVTNTVVSESDFNGGKPTIIRRILRAFPASETAGWFRGLGVPLHEEPGGKLFPDSNQSRDVLGALVGELDRAGAVLASGTRVVGVRRRDGGGFDVVTGEGTMTARAVALATGGLSLPKTGSDGVGYEIARLLGHSIQNTTPALAPLVLDPGHEIHRQLSGVSVPARLDLRVDDRIVTRISGALLWTHFGISGPAALDMSRHWEATKRRGDEAASSGRLTASLLPAETFESLEAHWIEMARARPRLRLVSAVGEFVPASLASAVLAQLAIDEGAMMAELARERRRTLTRALLEWPLPVVGSRGYNYAEVTAGGVTLTEINPGTMESRIAPGLYLVGEVLDVDGRLGGFNFQWAWSSAYVAGSHMLALPR